MTKPSDNLNIYFLSVGQGDSELVILPGGVKILIDAGPDNKVIGELDSILRPATRSIILKVGLIFFRQMKILSTAKN